MFCGWVWRGLLMFRAVWLVFVLRQAYHIGTHPLRIFEKQREPLIQSEGRDVLGVYRQSDHLHDPLQVFVAISPVPPRVTEHSRLNFTDVLKHMKLRDGLPCPNLVLECLSGQLQVCPHEQNRKLPKFQKMRLIEPAFVGADDLIEAGQELTHGTSPIVVDRGAAVADTELEGVGSQVPHGGCFRFQLWPIVRRLDPLDG